MNRVINQRNVSLPSYADNNEISAVEKSLLEVGGHIEAGAVPRERDRVELDSRLISRFSAESGTSSVSKFKTSSTSSYSVAGCYTRLATASTKAQVWDVMATARRSISELRMTSCFGEAEDRAKARAAIASMQKLLHRGNRKIRRLNEEEIVKLRSRRAEKAEERREELALKIELKRMKAKRLSADSSIRAEGELEDMNHDFRFRKHYDNHPYISSGSAALNPPVPNTALPARAQTGAGEGMVSADVDIKIDAGISTGI